MPAISSRTTPCVSLAVEGKQRAASMDVAAVVQGGDREVTCQLFHSYCTAVYSFSTHLVDGYFVSVFILILWGLLDAFWN